MLGLLAFAIGSTACAAIVVSSLKLMDEEDIVRSMHKIVPRTLESAARTAGLNVGEEQLRKDRSDFLKTSCNLEKAVSHLEFIRTLPSRT